MKKKKTINTKPFDLRLEIDASSFVLIFDDEKKTVRVSFDDWWIQYLAVDLHKVIAARQDKINQLKRSLIGN